jgi:hypothetical protein
VGSHLEELLERRAHSVCLYVSTVDVKGGWHATLCCSMCVCLVCRQWARRMGLAGRDALTASTICAECVVRALCVRCLCVVRPRIHALSFVAECIAGIAVCCIAAS